MKALLASIFLFTSLSATAQNAVDHCTAYAGKGKERYLTAIEVVAKNHAMTLAELCQSPRYLGIEAQPSRKITREGEIIPHVAVQLHMYSSSCRFLIRDSDLALTDGSCYSGE